MKLSLVGGLAALVVPVAAQASSRVDVSARADVPAARVYQADWHHGWRRHYEPPVYYNPPVTVCPPPSTYYYEEPAPYCAPEYVTPEYVPPVVVEPDYGYYGGYWGGHYHHDWDRRGHGEHGWHRR